MPYLTFSITIPVFYWSGLNVVIGTIAIMLVYWIGKSIISVITGG